MRSESRIVSFSEKKPHQNKILLKRGGWELPSVWKTLLQETCNVVTGMSLAGGLLSQNLLQNLRSCRGACVSLCCYQPCKSLAPSLPLMLCADGKGARAGFTLCMGSYTLVFLDPLDNFVRTQLGCQSSGKAWRVV